MDIDFYSDSFNIVLGFKQKSNCDAVKKILQQKNGRYIVKECDSYQCMSSADLLVIDGAFMEEKHDDIMRHKEESLPVFFPVLLVTANPQAEIVTKNLWVCIDELLRMPVLMPELFARIEILLRARKSSKDANVRASILSKEIRLKNLLAHMAFGGGFFRISLDEYVVTFYGKEGESDKSVSLGDWLNGFYPDYKDKIERYLFYDTEREPFVLSYPHMGTRRWDIIQLIKVGDRGSVAYGMWMDFTREKEREEKLETLLSERNELIKELQHRARTSLQMVSSLINLKEDSVISDSERFVLREVNTRIKAILFLYQRIYREDNMYKPEMGEFIKNLVPLLINSLINKASGISCDISVCNMSASIDKANSIAILIAELVILAVKRGLADCKSPEFSLSLTCHGDYAELVYRDNLGKIGIDDKEYEFSLSILRIISQERLGGSMDISVDEKGFYFYARIVV